MFQFPALALTLSVSDRPSDGRVVPFGNLRINGYCTYPKLIAAYHVLHRLCEPRHPPYALSYFLLIKDKARIYQATSIALYSYCFTF